jgi:hypothetical protein
MPAIVLRDAPEREAAECYQCDEFELSSRMHVMWHVPKHPKINDWPAAPSVEKVGS